MNTSPPPIEVKALKHFFGEGEARKQALYDINLSFQSGSLTVLMGPSGSGKTTLLTLMACLRSIQSGEVNLLGKAIKNCNVDEQLHLRQQLGFIFQAHNLHQSLSARQNVMMALTVAGKGDSYKQSQAAGHMLGLLGLAERADYLPENLSGGQKQRVAIARALVSNPKVIFADEPTAALDKENGIEVVRILKQLGQERGTTTVMVTHDNRILEFADRIIVLEDGHVISDKLS